MAMRPETRLLHDWYAAVISDRDTWAAAVMTDPENGIVYSRLAACAFATVEALLKLAELDPHSDDTLERVREAIRGASANSEAGERPPGMSGRKGGP